MSETRHRQARVIPPARPSPAATSDPTSASAALHPPQPDFLGLSSNPEKPAIFPQNSGHHKTLRNPSAPRATGVIVLPGHIAWSFPHSYDLDNPKDLRAAYARVMTEGAGGLGR